MSNLKYFADCRTKEAARSMFLKLCMVMHPDKGGSCAKFVEMKNEYEKIMPHLPSEPKDKPEWKTEQETAEETAIYDEVYQAVVEALSRLSGIGVELCGAWLWISGETYENRAALKSAGCFFSSQKKMWYWRPAEYQRRFNRRSMDIDDIRDKFGTVRVIAPKYNVVCA